jgi:2-methylisocitrate lyase-like PEP mutase family enzyme
MSGRDATRKRERLRELIDDGEMHQLPTIHDPVTAQIVETVGFDAAMMSGSRTSLSKLGLPDAGYVTMSEAVENARNIAAAVDIPVMIDGDTGFGNAINARRTTRELIEHTTAAGVFYEDQVTPKRCGKVAGKEVVSADEAVGKIRAVCDLRDELDPEFVVMGRTDAIGAVGGSLDDAIDRAQRFAEAGADLVFVEAPLDMGQIERCAEEIDAPLYCCRDSLSDQDDFEAAESLGYALVSGGGSMIPLLVNLYDYFEGVKEGQLAFTREWSDSVEDHPVSDRHAFSGFDEIRELEEQYLPDDVAERYEASVGYQPGE